MLHFLTESDAIRFIDEANGLGIEWSPSQVIHQNGFVSIRMSVSRRSEMKKLQELYENMFPEV